MRTLFLSAGHGGIDVGAVGNGYTEADLTIELRDLINKHLLKLGIKAITDDNKNALAQTIRFFQNKVTKDCILVDIHWNSFNNTSTGAEVLIPAKPSQLEVKIATDLSKVISSTLSITNRGVKTELQSARGRLGWMRLTGENILIETCFISNPNDMKSYQSNKEKLAESIANVLANYILDSKQGNIYIVKKGDSLSKIAKENKTTVEKIKKDNSLKTDTIQIGQQIKI
jgi:N-acetylmuramoyl-L-alanine amidase